MEKNSWELKLGLSEAKTYTCIYICIKLQYAEENKFMGIKVYQCSSGIYLYKYMYMYVGTAQV